MTRARGDGSDAPRTCGCGCGAPVQRSFAPGHYARVAPRTLGGRMLPSFGPGPCACGCGMRARSVGARYRREHRPTGPGARGGVLVVAGTPRHAAFAAYLRGVPTAADLRHQARSLVRSLTWRVALGQVPTPRTLARLAGVLGVPTEELLARAPVRGTSEAARLVSRALARIGATRADLAARVGVSRFAMRQWLDGTRRPSPDHLERLVAALDEPALRELLEPTAAAGKVRLACRGCGETRTFWPSKVTRMGSLARTRPGWAPVVDRATMTGTYTCRACRACRVGRAR